MRQNVFTRTESARKLEVQTSTKLKLGRCSSKDSRSSLVASWTKRIQLFSKAFPFGTTSGTEYTVPLPVHIMRCLNESILSGQTIFQGDTYSSTTILGFALWILATTSNFNFSSDMVYSRMNASRTKAVKMLDSTIEINNF